jgi:selenide, water dikinase
MVELNRAAGEVLAESGAVHALTDITGFGLLGHAWEMADGSGVGLRLRLDDVPVIEGVRDLAAAGFVPGGSKANLAWVTEHVRFGPRVDASLQLVLADAQTNGGLFAAVDPARAAEVFERLRAVGARVVTVGEVVDGPPRIDLD